MKLIDKEILIEQIARTADARHVQEIVIQNIELTNQGREQYKNLPELLVVTGEIKLKTKVKEFTHTFCKDNNRLIF